MPMFISINASPRFLWPKLNSVISAVAGRDPVYLLNGSPWGMFEEYEGKRFIPSKVLKSIIKERNKNSLTGGKARKPFNNAIQLKVDKWALEHIYEENWEAPQLTHLGCSSELPAFHPRGWIVDESLLTGVYATLHYVATHYAGEPNNQCVFLGSPEDENKFQALHEWFYTHPHWIPNTITLRFKIIRSFKTAKDALLNEENPLRSNAAAFAGIKKEVKSVVGEALTGNEIDFTRWQENSRKISKGLLLNSSFPPRVIDVKTQKMQCQGRVNVSPHGLVISPAHLTQAQIVNSEVILENHSLGLLKAPAENTKESILTQWQVLENYFPPSVLVNNSVNAEEKNPHEHPIPAAFYSRPNLNSFFSNPQAQAVSGNFCLKKLWIWFGLVEIVLFGLLGFHKALIVEEPILLAILVSLQGIYIAIEALKRFIPLYETLSPERQTSKFWTQRSKLIGLTAQFLLAIGMNFGLIFFTQGKLTTFATQAASFTLAPLPLCWLLITLMETGLALSQVVRALITYRRMTHATQRAELFNALHQLAKATLKTVVLFFIFMHPLALSGALSLMAGLLLLSLLADRLIQYWRTLSPGQQNSIKEKICGTAPTSSSFSPVPT